MKIKHAYLAVAILGTLIPYCHFGQFLSEHGLNPNEFVSQMQKTNISSFFAWDVILSTLAVVVLVVTEGKRKGMNNLWIYIVFNLVVGVSLALPAFLYARQTKIDKKEPNNG
jgi:hypothetical protein